MKVQTQSVPNLGAFSWSRASDYFELAKPEITFLVTITTLVGFYLGAASPVPLWRLSHALLGTAFVAGGASAFNMYIERYLDALMRRTQNRPLPAGRMNSINALLFATIVSVCGMLYLWTLVNPLTSAIAALTFFSYVGIYTPLKKRTWLCTLIGAVPGALPAVMGWTAATGTLSAGGWVLFLIVFLWQMPHFYALGWMYREDYARAAFSILPVLDSAGTRTARQVTIYLLLLLAVSIIPFTIHMAGLIYLLGAAALGLLFLAHGTAFARLRDRASARRLFFFSLLYLPALAGLLIFDKAVS